MEIITLIMVGDKMNIAICEDDYLFAKKLAEKAEDFFKSKEIEVEIDIFTDGRLLVEKYREKRAYELIFMDIQLDNSDGMNIAGEVRDFDKSVPVIFVTSIENRALDGYDVNAYGYIVKTRFEDKFQSVMQRLWDNYFCETMVILKTKTETTIVPARKILWAESDDRNTIVNTDDGNKYCLTESIRQFSERLPEKVFIESHKSVFVNIEHIEKINSNSLTIKGNILPVSRRNHKNVLYAIMERIALK